MNKSFLLFYESSKEDSVVAESGFNLKLDPDLIKQIEKVAKEEDVTVTDWVTYVCSIALEQSAKNPGKSTHPDDLTAIVRDNAELIRSLKEEMNNLRKEIKDTKYGSPISAIPREPQPINQTPIKESPKPIEKNSEYPENIQFSLKTFSDELEQPFWSEAEILEAKIKSSKISK